MKPVALLLTFLLAAAAAAGAQPVPSATGATRPVPVIHHAVSANPAAQAAFDRGLLDYYAYNPEAAEHEFYTVIDLDSQNPMGWWGIALSNAPNLNVAANDDRDDQAREAIQEAKRLEGNASVEDRLFIDAAAARFDDKTKASADTLLANYRDALKRIATAYPDDPDAAALYGEAALYVVAELYRTIGVPTPAQIAAFTQGAAALLPYYQTSLAKFPKHVGLLHFYIHAAQLAGRSAAAREAAIQLAAFVFPPQDSHLTHMPGHTFFDLGMYEAALDVGQRSVAMDYAAFDCCHPGYYSGPRYYHEHNVSFLLYAMTQTGHISDAVAVARRDGNNVFIARQLLVAQDWQAVLAVPYADAQGPTLPFARGLAFAKLGDIGQAQAWLAKIPNAPAGSPARAAIVKAMRLSVEAQLALDQHDNAKALQLLTGASDEATKGDRLAGGVEMPTLYFYSPHMALAQLAIRLGDASVARAALQAELVASPGSSAATQALAQLGNSR